MSTTIVTRVVQALPLNHKLSKLCKNCGGTERYEKSRGCIACARLRAVKWQKVNREKRNERSRRWYAANQEKLTEYKRNWNAANTDKWDAYSRKWDKANLEKRVAYAGKYRAAKLRAIPLWADLKIIEEFYINCPYGYVVDHVVPLQGKNVSGLHVLNNLAYLTKSENSQKSNNF